MLSKARLAGLRAGVEAPRQQEGCAALTGAGGGALSLLVPAAVFPSCFEILSLLPAIVDSHSINQSLKTSQLWKQRN